MVTNMDFSEALDRQEQLTQETENDSERLNNIIQEKQKLLERMANIAHKLEQSERKEEGSKGGNSPRHFIEQAEKLTAKEEELTKKYEELSAEEKEITNDMENVEKDLEGLEKKIDSNIDSK